LTSYIFSCCPFWTNQNRQRQSRWKQMSRGRPKNGGCCCPELC